MYNLFVTWTRKKALIVACMTTIIAICNEIMDSYDAELLKANSRADMASINHIQKELTSAKELLNIAKTISIETQRLTINKSTVALLKLTASNIVQMLETIAERRSRHKEIIRNFKKANRFMNLTKNHPPARKLELFPCKKRSEQSGIKFLLQSQ